MAGFLAAGAFLAAAGLRAGAVGLDRRAHDGLGGGFGDSLGGGFGGGFGGGLLDHRGDVLHDLGVGVDDLDVAGDRVVAQLGDDRLAADGELLVGLDLLLERLGEVGAEGGGPRLDERLDLAAQRLRLGLQLLDACLDGLRQVVRLLLHLLDQRLDPASAAP